ncbi:MAG: hypothetical protein HKN13_14275 [Rhodothermales bacterium]|nr:hypothetical protein [Rhodothermales bacterium]
MNRETIRSLLTDTGEAVAAEVRRILLNTPLEVRTRVHGHTGSDVIYDIDHEVEGIVVDHISRNARSLGGIVLIAEGIGADEKTVYPTGMPEQDAALRIIIDPIDGTRPIMYDKRSAFFLAGASVNRGESTTLADVEVAVMVEIPTTRAGVSDTLWAHRGSGAYGERIVHATGERQAFRPQPSSNPSIKKGFVQFVRFFNPGKEEIAAIEDALMAKLFPDAEHGESLTFEDQYLSTGGQLYELLTGKDRLVVDVRSALYRKHERTGRRTGHPCHPYDLAACLIASEAGIILTRLSGMPFDAPMDTLSGADWIGYANQSIRNEVESVLTQLLREYDLVP